ncbi:MAG TPA: 4-oxalomesaconate tautomerase [Acidimicrobiales bacterium]|nr:4-oxalomesaconate tautomerase [Acidimicrobiales bacterium]
MRPVAIPASLMRGGTSKGLFFLAENLPEDRATRDAVLLAAMGSPDVREIDGVGGAHPLTSKVAVVRRSTRVDADVDYLFLQVWPDRAEVSDRQNCGNMLAAVGPFALEEGLLAADGERTRVRIFMENTQSVAVATIETPGGQVNYDGNARIDGVPGQHAPVPIEFLDVAGSSCGALLPTGHAADVIDGLRVTCIDNGMPVVCVRAADLGVEGHEDPLELEANAALVERVESLRLAAGHLMNLGDVTTSTVPKVSLLSSGRRGGQLDTRTFIPHRVHEAIGVFGAVSVATACLIEGSVAHDIAGAPVETGTRDVVVEHPSGYFTVTLDVVADGSGARVDRVSLLRTARLLMRGDVMVPRRVWESQ